MANIQIALAPKRGVPPVFLMVDTDKLSTEQLRVVREYLPVDRKTGHPILRGLDKEHRSRDLMIPDEAGELQPVKFKFDIPANLVDTDAPALLDKWHQLLKEAKAKSLKRMERAQARALKEQQNAAKQAAQNESAAQKPAEGVDASATVVSDLTTAQNETSVQDDGEPEHTAAAGEAEAASVQAHEAAPAPSDAVDQNASGLGEVMELLQLVGAFDARAAARLPQGSPSGEEGDHGPAAEASEDSEFGPEPPPVDIDQVGATEPPWERDEPPMEGEAGGAPEDEEVFGAEGDVRGRPMPAAAVPVGQQPLRRPSSPYDDAYAVLRKLPLLDDFEVDPFPSSEALLLPPARSGDQFRADDDDAPVVRGAILQVVAFDLRAMKFRHVMVDVEECLGQEWAELRQSLENEEDLGLRVTQAQELAQGVWEEFRHLAGELQWKAARTRKPLPSLGQLTDLARHLRIDLETARHTREQLLADMKAHPGWVAQVAAAIEEVHASGLDINQCTSVPALHGAFVRWAEAIGLIDTYAQLSLWSTSDYERLHKSLEVQVHRARLWMEQLQRNPVGAGAAVAMLVLGC